MDKFITVFDVAVARGVKTGDDGSVSGSEFARVGLPIMGGCARCEACIAAYNAYPSNSGYLVCGDCVHEDNGFSTTEEFEKFCKECDSEEDDDYEAYVAERDAEWAEIERSQEY